MQVQEDKEEHRNALRRNATVTIQGLTDEEKHVIPLTGCLAIKLKNIAVPFPRSLHRMLN